MAAPKKTTGTAAKATVEKVEEVKTSKKPQTPKEIAAAASTKDHLVTALSNGRYKVQGKDPKKKSSHNKPKKDYVLPDGTGKMIHVEISRRYHDVLNEEYKTMYRTQIYDPIEWPVVRQELLKIGWKIKYLHDGSKLLNGAEKKRYDALLEKSYQATKK